MARHTSRLASPPTVLRPLRLLGLATLGFAAACGPADEAVEPDEVAAIEAAPELLGSQTSALGEAKDGLNDRAPSQLKQFAKTASDAAKIFSEVQGHVGTAIAIARVLGFIDPAPDPFAELRAELDEVASALSWQILALQANDYRGTINAAFIEAQERNIAAGELLPRDGGFNANATAALNSAGGEVLFLRFFKETDTNGAWKDVITDKTPEKFGAEGKYVFDWRYPVPWYMQLVAERMTVMAAVDPEFTRNQSFNIELGKIRSTLIRLRDQMVRGVRCGQRARIVGQWYTHTDIACADVNTGVFMNTTFEVPNFQSCVFVLPGGLGVAEPSCVGRLPGQASVTSLMDGLRRTVLSKMPIYELQSMIDTLFHYMHPEIPDLTQNWTEQITIEAAQNLCLDLVGGNVAAGTGVQLSPCAWTNQQWWQYDRKSGRIFSPALNKCLQVRRRSILPGWNFPGLTSDNRNAGALAEIADCSVAAPSPEAPLAARQQWTYDPESKTVQSALNTVLDVQWGNLQSGTPVWLWDKNGGGAQRWQVSASCCN